MNSIPIPLSSKDKRVIKELNINKSTPHSVAGRGNEGGVNIVLPANPEPSFFDSGHLFPVLTGSQTGLGLKYGIESCFGIES